MDIKDIRRALSAQAGVPISQADFGGLLGLDSKNARNTVHRWEEGRATGPAMVAARYLLQGCMDETMASLIPEHICGEPLGDGGGAGDIFVRLHWPRFLATAVSAEVPIYKGAEWAWIAEGIERLVVLMWIDQPDGVPGSPPADYWIKRAAAAVQEYTLDSITGDHDDDDQ